MNKETAIIILNIVQRKFTVDIEVPLDISANDLVNGLNIAYKLLFEDGEPNCIVKRQ